MPTSDRQAPLRRHRTSVAVLIAVTSLTAACASSPSTPQPVSKEAAPPTEEAASSIPVLPYGRYALVELTPTDGQRDLMQQAIDVSIPAAANATVGDALRYVLQRSGYRLCDDGTAPTSTLYGLPLPAAHEHLGPLMLRDALTILAGPRWTLQVNERMREVCFAEMSDVPSQLPPASPPISVETPAVQSMTSTPAQPPLGDRP